MKSHYRNYLEATQLAGRHIPPSWEEPVVGPKFRPKFQVTWGDKAVGRGSTLAKAIRSVLDNMPEGHASVEELPVVLSSQEQREQAQWKPDCGYVWNYYHSRQCGLPKGHAGPHKSDSGFSPPTIGEVINDSLRDSGGSR